MRFSDFTKVFQRKFGDAPGLVPVYIAALATVDSKQKTPMQQHRSRRERRIPMKQKHIAALMLLCLVLAFLMLVVIGLRDKGFI